MKEIPLTKGFFALVDDEDYERLSFYSWCAHRSPRKKTYCAKRVESGRTIYMHREIMGLLYGDIRQVDHKDYNGLNNQKYNLRIASSTQNQKNMPPRDHSSKYRGVTWDGQRGKWRAQAQIDGRMKNIGRFPTEEAAALARDEYVAANDQSGFIQLAMAGKDLGIERPIWRQSRTGD
jgi:hypothetical protein